MTELSRRTLIAGVAAAAALGPTATFAVAGQPAGPHTLPPLPYAFDALEPHIDARTMELHHGKHHGAQVANLNAALKDHGELQKLTLDQLLSKIAEVPDTIRVAVRNNAGGHANHSMFWQIMGPRGGTLEGNLKAAVDRDLGGLEKLQSEFNTAGTKLFGSGWVFLVKDKDGKLSITTRPNQDNPIMDGLQVVLGNDVWEHAYYLNYQNRRADYLKAWWNTVDWKSVAKRYEAV